MCERRADLAYGNQRLPPRCGISQSLRYVLAVFQGIGRVYVKINKIAWILRMIAKARQAQM